MIPNFDYPTLLRACHSAIYHTHAILPSYMDERDLASMVYLKIYKYDKPLEYGALVMFSKQVILDITLRTPKYNRTRYFDEYESINIQSLPDYTPELEGYDEAYTKVMSNQGLRSRIRKDAPKRASLEELIQYVNSY